MSWVGISSLNITTGITITPPSKGIALVCYICWWGSTLYTGGCYRNRFLVTFTAGVQLQQTGQSSQRFWRRVLQFLDGPMGIVSVWPILSILHIFITNKYSRTWLIGYLCDIASVWLHFKRGVSVTLLICRKYSDWMAKVLLSIDSMSAQHKYTQLNQLITAWTRPVASYVGGRGNYIS